MPERSAGGSLGALTPLAPTFHIIDHVIYHTTLDVRNSCRRLVWPTAERAFRDLRQGERHVDGGPAQGEAAKPASVNLQSDIFNLKSRSLHAEPRHSSTPRVMNLTRGAAGAAGAAPPRPTPGVGTCSGVMRSMRRVG